MPLYYFIYYLRKLTKSVVVISQLPSVACHGEDQQVQTCSSPFNEQHDFSAETNALIQTPFCRDPDDLLKPSDILQQRKYGHQYRVASPVNNGGGAYRHGVPKINEKPKFSGRGIMYEQPKPYQKVPSTPKTFVPKPSSPTFSHSSYGNNDNSAYDSENNMLSGDSWNQTSSSPTSEKRFGLGPAHRNNNPIAEMQRRGRRQSTSDETDDPPFNFQAMLRKTNYKRASLKRDANSHLPANANYMYNQDKNFSPARGNNVVFQSSNTRNCSPSPTPSFASENLDFQSPYHRQLAPDKKFSNKMNGLPDTMTELAPGIVIQGQVADL